MARTKQSVTRQKEFSWTDEAVIAGNSRAPQVRARKQALADPEAREIISAAISNAVQACKMPKVNSNRELIQRIEQFFQLAAERQTYPTVEEMALYCGFSASTFRDWRLGRKNGFSDSPDGLTTSQIVIRALDVMHIIDASLTGNGKMNPVFYMMRASNYFGMTQKSEIEITPHTEQHNMTPEEIREFAMNLPDASDYMEE